MGLERIFDGEELCCHSAIQLFSSGRATNYDTRGTPAEATPQKISLFPGPKALQPPPFTQCLLPIPGAALLTRPLCVALIPYFVKRTTSDCRSGLATVTASPAPGGFCNFSELVLEHFQSLVIQL